MSLAREAIEDHVRWAEKVTSSPTLAPARRDLTERRTIVTDRLTDPNLYIGFFGEFSSGKSTMLNALLGTQLLPSSALVTTSLITTLRPADEERLELTRVGTSLPLRWGTKAFAKWVRTVTGSPPDGDLRRVLHDLIHADDAGNTIASIDLALPQTLLGPDLVLVDTPGFNAIRSEHRDIAVSAAERVDLAVILIAANSPGSIVLAEFLADVMSEFRDRCVFVLTKCRQIPATERDELERWVKGWLAAEGFGGAKLLRADATDLAVAALDSPHSFPADSPVESDVAIGEARRLAADLEGLAGTSRDRFIDASLSTLLDQLLVAITDAGKEARRDLRETKRSLDEVKITDLDQFLDDWHLGALVSCEKGTKKAVTSQAKKSFPQSKLATLRGEAVARVDETNDVPAIVATLTAKTEEVLLSWCQARVAAATKEAWKRVTARAEDLADDFERSYGELARLADQPTTVPPFDRRAAAVDVSTIGFAAEFASVREKAVALKSSANWKTGSGIAIGALVGTVLAPGLGTAVGGWMGKKFSSGRDNQKVALSEAIDSMHADCMDAARGAVTGTVQNIMTAIESELDQLWDRYMAETGPAVDALKKSEADRRAALQRDLRFIDRTLSEAKKRRATTNPVGRKHG